MKIVPAILLLAFPCFAQSTNTPAPNVYAWGDNSSGQCDVPTSLTNALAIAAGTQFSMALKPDGTVVVWGAPQDFGFTVTNAVAIAADDAAWVFLADGTYHASKPGWQSWLTDSASSAYEGFEVDQTRHLPVFPTISTISNATGMVGIGGGGGGYRGSYLVLSKVDGTTAWAGDFSGYCQYRFPHTPMSSFAYGGPGYGFYVWLSPDGTVGARDDDFWNTHSSYYSSGIENPLVPITNVMSVAANASCPLALKTDGTLETWGGYTYQSHFFYDYRWATNYPGISNVVAIAGNRHANTFLALRADGVVIDTATGVPANPSLPFAHAITLGSTHALALVQPDVPVTPPMFFSQAQTQTVPVGGHVVLQAIALGFGPITYQWYLGQTNALIGATNYFLELTNIQPQQSGVYTLVAANSVGSVTNAPSFISVAPVLDVAMVPAVYMHGGVGTTYRLDYINALGPTNAWVPLATMTLTISPQIYFDLSANGQPARYYRLVQVP